MNGPSPDELAGLFAGLLAEIVSTVSGFSPDVLPSEPDADFGWPGGLVTFMNLGDACGGTLFISASEADMRALCAAMTGAPRDQITKADACDTLCELANMTAGNAKLRLGPAYAFALSSPLVITGEGMSLVMKKRVRTAGRRLEGGGVGIGVRVVCAN